jgi:hypothetical protein
VLSGGFSFLASNSGFVFGAVFVVWVLNTLMMLRRSSAASLVAQRCVDGRPYLACLRGCAENRVGDHVFDGSSSAS